MGWTKRASWPISIGLSGRRDKTERKVKNLTIKDIVKSFMKKLTEKSDKIMGYALKKGRGNIISYNIVISNPSPVIPNPSLSVMLNLSLSVIRINSARNLNRRLRANSVRNPCLE